MRVLLIKPASHDGCYRSEGIKFIPYGLLYVAAYGRERGHQFRILDRNVDSASLRSWLNGQVAWRGMKC